MTTVVLTNALLAALAVVMGGLGLSLTVDDFRRLRSYPLAAVLALGLQLIVLPLACVGVIAAFGLSPLYAVGLMLLAASPGGITANLFSHLFGGHVAMNLSLTALNTLLSLVTLPLIANWAIAHYAGGGQVVPLPWQKLAEVIGVIAVPVLAGMAVRRSRPDIAQRLDKPVKGAVGRAAAGADRAGHRQGARSPARRGGGGGRRGAGVQSAEPGRRLWHEPPGAAAAPAVHCHRLRGGHPQFDAGALPRAGRAAAVPGRVAGGAVLGQHVCHGPGVRLVAATLTRMKLLGRLASINVRKVLWAAAQLGLELDREDWGPGFRSPKEPEYLALNPNGLIPVLIDGDFVLWESNTICRYLASKHAATALLPTEPQARARVEQWMDWQAGELNNSWARGLHGAGARPAGHARSDSAGRRELEQVHDHPGRATRPAPVLM